MTKKTLAIIWLIIALISCFIGVIGVITINKTKSETAAETRKYKEEILPLASEAFSDVQVPETKSIWIGWPVDACWISVPCVNFNLSAATSELQDECIAMLDIGIRTIDGTPYKQTDTKNVSFPKDGWEVERSGRDCGDAIFKFSEDGRKLIVVGTQSGTVHIKLFHKDVKFPKDIFVTVVDWDTWEYRKMP